jgi:AraC family transcriptional regulator
MNALRPLPADTLSPSETASIVQIDPPDIAHRQFASWRGLRADLVNIVRNGDYQYNLQADQPMFIMCERAARDDGETVIEGLPRSTQQDFSRTMSLVPAGHKFHGWQKPRALMRVAYFYLDPQNSLIDPELGFAGTQLQPRLFFFDRDLWETAAKIKTQAENGESGRQDYAETLTMVLFHEIMRLNNGRSSKPQTLRGGLAGWQKNRIVDYVEEHLAEDISLTTLADLARLSPFHFARAFKRSFDRPPHRYLTTRRIERAKSLLADSELTATEIGARIGFSDTSSFSSAFRKHTGTAPTDYRRGLD